MRAVIVGACLFLAGCDPISFPGRYQIVNGHYQNVTTHNASDIPAVFKIDTATGKTWMYTDMYFAGIDGSSGFGDGWKEIGDYRWQSTSAKPSQQ